MTKMMMIGDVHGKWSDYAQILNDNQPDHSVQIGDFGWGFHGQETEYMQRHVAAVEQAMASGNNRYIRGNHDNPAMCASHKFYIPDGSYDASTGIMYIGGALSIDRDLRTQGIDWWDDEELSYPDLQRLIDLYESVQPRVMITHECPEDVVGYLFSWYQKMKIGSRTRDALGSMLYLHRPALWVFGHWHQHVDRVIDGTRFICLAELQAAMLDLDTLTVTYIEGQEL